MNLTVTEGFEHNVTVADSEGVIMDSFVVNISQGYRDDHIEERHRYSMDIETQYNISDGDILVVDGTPTYFEEYNINLMDVRGISAAIVLSALLLLAVASLVLSVRHEWAEVSAKQR